MALTANGIYYPGESDSGDVAYQMSQMAASIESSPLVLAGRMWQEAIGTTTPVALGATGTNYVPSTSTATFTLPSQRRVVIHCRARFGQRTAAAGNYLLLPALNSGTYNLSAVSTIGQGAQVNTNGNGSTSDEDAVITVTTVLAAGQWTVYPIARRTATMGSASDVVSNGYTLVTDAGAS